MRKKMDTFLCMRWGFQPSFYFCPILFYIWVRRCVCVTQIICGLVPVGFDDVIAPGHTHMHTHKRVWSALCLSPQLFTAVPVGIGQVYVCDNPCAGGIFMIAFLISSPITCAHATIGSAVGMVSGKHPHTHQTTYNMNVLELRLGICTALQQSLLLVDWVSQPMSTVLQKCSRLGIWIVFCTVWFSRMNPGVCSLPVSLALLAPFDAIYFGVITVF